MGDVHMCGITNSASLSEMEFIIKYMRSWLSFAQQMVHNILRISRIIKVSLNFIVNLIIYYLDICMPVLLLQSIINLFINRGWNTKNNTKASLFGLAFVCNRNHWVRLG